jgi:hypothetical protein
MSAVAADAVAGAFAYSPEQLVEWQARLDRMPVARRKVWLKDNPQLAKQLQKPTGTGSKRNT